jgi:O-Antigen ligase
LIYFLQIFNPLQGGLSVGFSGALFMLVPVAWFYFGQTIKTSFVETAFEVIVVLGIITSLYGVYQLAFGFPSYEQYWIDNTEFYNSISVGNVKRALATYSSAEEWGRYIEIAALIAFGFAAGRADLLRRAGWFLAGATLTVMLVLTGQRTAVFGLILGCVVLLLLGARTWRAVVGRVLLVLAPALLVAVLVKAPTNDDLWSHSEDDRAGAILSHTARGTLRPTEEGSLQERFTNWTWLATEVVPYRPLGVGLGATSLGAWRWSAEVDLPPIDSYFISTVVTCGLPTALLFMWILIKASRMSWRAFRNAEPGSAEPRVWRIAATLMPVLILNSLFGNTFTLYSVAPISWLLIGWISANHLRQAAAVSPAESQKTYVADLGGEREQFAI